jgi:hypothetical protein
MQPSESKATVNCRIRLSRRSRKMRRENTNGCRIGSLPNNFTFCEPHLDDRGSAAGCSWPKMQSPHPNAGAAHEMQTQSSNLASTLRCQIAFRTTSIQDRVSSTNQFSKSVRFAWPDYQALPLVITITCTLTQVYFCIRAPLPDHD